MDHSATLLPVEALPGSNTHDAHSAAGGMSGRPAASRCQQRGSWTIDTPRLIRVRRPGRRFLAAVVPLLPGRCWPAQLVPGFFEGCFQGPLGCGDAPIVAGCDIDPFVYIDRCHVLA